MQGKVEICGINTSKLQTLSNAEMMRLIERSQQGDMEARSRLVEGNLKLVLSVVQRFLSLLSQISSGCQALDIPLA